jgi:hypothetical protein
MQKTAIIRLLSVGAGAALSGILFVTPAFASTYQPNYQNTGNSGFVCDRYATNCLLQQWNYVSGQNIGYSNTLTPQYGYSNNNYGYQSPSYGYTAPYTNSYSNYPSYSYNSPNYGYQNGNYYPVTNLYSTPSYNNGYQYQYQYQQYAYPTTNQYSYNNSNYGYQYPSYNNYYRGY